MFREPLDHKVRILKSSTVYVPSSELGLSQTPLSPASVPLPQNRGGGHSPAGEGLGETTNSDDWRKSLALCLLCALDPWEGGGEVPWVFFMCKEEQSALLLVHT